MKKIPYNLGVEIEDQENVKYSTSLSKYSKKISPAWIQNRENMNKAC